jgi:tRNA1Val (adenine37-N6)-methyltransferase
MKQTKRIRSSVFQFKEFLVDQADCAMKINTDGVLLGAIAGAYPVEIPEDAEINIMDVGTGTGVIALMMAQRFSNAKVVAVEKEASAACRAYRNVAGSPFHDRISVTASAFQDILPEQHTWGAFDLIVSNPPFFLDSLRNPDSLKSMARHAGLDFFRELFSWAAMLTRADGYFQLILPLEVLAKLEDQVLPTPYLDWHWKVTAKKWVYSFPEDAKPVRCLLTLQKCKSSSSPGLVQESNMMIYDKPQRYSESYRHLLSPFFLDF